MPRGCATANRDAAAADDTGHPFAGGRFEVTDGFELYPALARAGHDRRC
jgi:hypothetical protein